MPTITFNAFSFLQKKLRANNLAFSNVRLTIDPGTRVKDLIPIMKLEEDDVEVVFLNGRVGNPEAVLKDDDRVAFVPHGTPGPYRVLLGFKNKQDG